MRFTETTVPYVALGPRAVTLIGVQGLRCVACDDLEVHVPARRALDAFARGLCVDDTVDPPMLVHRGHWLVDAGEYAAWSHSRDYCRGDL